MTTLLGMLGLGLLEMLVILCAGLLMLMTFGGLFAALGSVFPASRGPCILGVCWRLARHLEAPVRAVRLLIVAAIVLTGILPGVLLYLAAGVIQSWFDGAIDESLPGFAATDTGPMVLGVCRRLARRLDVRVGPVRLLVALVGLVTGVFPGLILYFLAAFLRTDHARRSLGRYSQILDTLRHDLPAASDRSGAFRAASTRPRRIGRYRILGELGVGGMGTVYRGRDDALARDAAVKVIRPLPGDDADARQRFGEEARAAASLASPHIVQIYEFDPVGSPPFLAMELVPGVSVQRMVQRQGAMPAATVVDCAQQVLAGLATAHAAGIIHRDIKPANILLATSGPAAGTYKLTDFGLARSPDRQHTLTASGSLLGTLLYLAPEVAIGDDATAPSDLYSLGATLHEMLAGRPPLTADSPLKHLRRITTETPPPISHARPDLPADLAQVPELPDQLVAAVGVISPKDGGYKVKNPGLRAFAKRGLAGQVHHPQLFEDGQRRLRLVGKYRRRDDGLPGAQPGRPVRAGGGPLWPSGMLRRAACCRFFPLLCGHGQSFLPPAATRRGGAAGVNRPATFFAASAR